MAEIFLSVKEFNLSQVILQRKESHLGFHEQSQYDVQGEASFLEHDDFQIEYQQYYQKPHWDYLYIQKLYNFCHGVFLNHPLMQNSFLHDVL